jgi:hypothetical protein
LVVTWGRNRRVLSRRVCYCSCRWRSPPVMPQTEACHLIVPHRHVRCSWQRLTETTCGQTGDRTAPSGSRWRDATDVASCRRVWSRVERWGKLPAVLFSQSKTADCTSARQHVFATRRSLPWLPHYFAPLASPALERRNRATNAYCSQHMLYIIDP